MEKSNNEKIIPKFKKGDIVCLFFDKKRRFLVKDFILNKNPTFISYKLLFFSVTEDEKIYSGNIEKQYSDDGVYKVSLQSDGNNIKEVLHFTYIDEEYLILAPEE